MARKYASSRTNNPAMKKNSTTRNIALLIGLRLAMTPMPHTSIATENIQKRRSCMARRANREPRNLNREPRTSFLLPFLHQSRHHTAEFVELVLVMHHLFTRVASDRIIRSQVYGLFGTNLLAQAAVDATDHINVELLRLLLDLAVLGVLR